MSKDTDEPLEGDIGPASAHSATAAPWATHAQPPDEPAADTTDASEAPEAPEAVDQDEQRLSAAAELLLLEAEREERRRRSNALSGRIAFVLATAFLAFLAYDSVRTAMRAHAKGDDWIYPPAVNAGICGIALLILAAWAIRRRRTRG